MLLTAREGNEQPAANLFGEHATFSAFRTRTVGEERVEPRSEAARIHWSGLLVEGDSGAAMSALIRDSSLWSRASRSASRAWSWAIV